MVKIRLARHGAKKRPYYRIVVADSRCPRDGKFIDDIGRYNPLTEPAMIKIDLEKCDQWLANGAQPTDTVAALIKKCREPAYASWQLRPRISPGWFSPSFVRSSIMRTTWSSMRVKPKMVPSSWKFA